MFILITALSFFLNSSCRAIDLTNTGAETSPQQPTANSPQPAIAAEDPDIELASRLERGFTKLAKRVAPAVVSLKVHVKQGSWLEELRRMNDQFGLSPQREFEGSGVIIDPAGMIATNEHVVRGADSIQVTFSDGRVCPATVCGSDPRSDLAVIRLTGAETPKNLQSATLTDSDAVEVGQWVIAVGNPFGLSHTLTLGIVSARGRSMPEQRFNSDVFYGNLIQTDAAINPGNSGGALFDMRGRLIGINTMIFSKTGVSQGFGFAIPSNHLAKRVALLKSGREVEYGWLGIQLQDLDPAKRVFTNVPENKGVLIEGVIPNTPADRAGLQPMMVVLSFDGRRVMNKEELIACVNETPVGRSVKLTAIDKQGKLVDVAVRVSKRNAELVQATRFGRPGEAPEPVDLEEAVAETPENSGKPAPALAPVLKNAALWRGMQVRELPVEDGAKRGGRLEVVRVKKGSPADRAGLFEGAVLVELKSASNLAVQKFETLDEFSRATRGAAGPVMLNTIADGFITIDEK
jgi:serine protease Do